MDYKIRIMTLAERPYCYTQSQQIMAQTGCIGHLRADMGTDGSGFYSSWDDHISHFKTQEFRDELDAVINDFRFGNTPDALLANRSALTKYCYEHVDAMFENGREFGVRVDTEKYTYMMRLNPNCGEYNLYCYCYRRAWLDLHIANAEKGIRFIDYNYNLKFRIPDGGQIRIIEGPDKGEIRTCRFVDEYHVEVGYNLFNIHEFAKLIDRNGYQVEPACEVIPERKKNHTGAAKAVHSDKLEQLFSCTGRSLRRYVSQLRQDGCPICSDETGYYYADNQGEINDTVTRLNELVTKIANARTGMLYASAIEAENVRLEINITVN